MDTAGIARAWGAARDAVLTTLRAKATAPLEATALASEIIAAINAYDVHRAAIARLSVALQARNGPIEVVKEHAATANVVTLTGDLAKLGAIKARHSAATAVLCGDYLMEKTAKTATEALRVQARAALDQYRQNISPLMRRRSMNTSGASMLAFGWVPSAL